jgi:hypothetical protein
VELAREMGRAAWAPDLDERVATSRESLANRNDPNGNFQHTHMLTGGNAAQAQANARERLEQVVDTMSVSDPNFRFGREQENSLHAFGDSFSHVDLGTANQQGCPCMYGPPWGHSMPPWNAGRPDDPNTNPGQYRQYLGGLYDILASRAQKEKLAPRMTRDVFVETMMRDVAGIRGEEAQQRAAQGIIGRMEASRGGQ